MEEDKEYKRKYLTPDKYTKEEATEILHTVEAARIVNGEKYTITNEEVKAYADVLYDLDNGVVNDKQLDKLVGFIERSNNK